MSFYVSAAVPVETHVQTPGEMNEAVNSINTTNENLVKTLQGNETKLQQELQEKDEAYSKLEEKLVRTKFSNSKKNHKENALEISLDEVGRRNSELSTTNSKLLQKVELLQEKYDKANDRYQKLLSIGEEAAETVSNDSETVSNDSETAKTSKKDGKKTLKKK